MEHYAGHQQALLKNNKCIAVLSFSNHDNVIFENTFSKFDYDKVLDLCILQRDAYLDSIWDGTKFNVQMYPSWILGADLNWHPPVPEPEEQLHFWDETSLSWIKYPDEDIEQLLEYRKRVGWTPGEGRRV
jgi:hypothetical protein